MQQNKFGKYLKYAVGEIFLVMVGILLALQVNNWNQNRLQKIEQNAMIKNLNKEFIHNKNKLQEAVRANMSTLNARYKLIDLIGKSRDTLIHANIDSLILVAVTFEKFDPSENTISDIVQSGALRSFRHEKIKELIYEWTSLVKKLEKNYNVFELGIQNDLVPYMMYYYPFKDADILGDLKFIDNSKSKLKHDKFKIFYELRFENLLDDAIWRCDLYMKGLIEARTLIDKLIEETNY